MRPIKRNNFQTNQVFAYLVIIAFMAFLSGCKKDTKGAEVPDRLKTGEGEFVYTGYAPLADKPVKVHYYFPKNLPENAPIVFVMHGNGRNASGYRKSMIPHAQSKKFLLVVPEFSTVHYPDSRDYHQGGVFDKNGVMKNREDWTFSIIEPLFEHMKKVTGNKNAGYILYGFSAGSQFVHRFNWFMPDNRATKMVTAAAGSYTMPDYDIDYIYGLGKTNISKANLAKAFARDVTVMVGSADTDLTRADLPKTKEANRQGKDRVERAGNFFLQCRQYATREGLEFNWNYALAPGVEHSQSQMAPFVIKEIFGN